MSHYYDPIWGRDDITSTMEYNKKSIGVHEREILELKKALNSDISESIKDRLHTDLINQELRLKECQKRLKSNNILLQKWDGGDYNIAKMDLY